MDRPRLALYGNFGIRNIGNECTLSAIVFNLRRRVPAAELFCVCSNPVEVRRDHGLPSVPIEPKTESPDAPPRHQAPGTRAGLPARLLNFAFKTFPRSVRQLRHAWRTMGRAEALILVGTGMLEDDDDSIGWLLPLLVWATAARLRGCRVLALSIGAGPFLGPRTRFLAHSILRLADYTSYRDQQSLDYVASSGRSTRGHRVVPDLAFSLPLPVTTASTETQSRGQCVSVGVIDRSKFHDETRYLSYVEGLSAFVVWLLDSGRRVRLIHGDGTYDNESLDRLQQALRARGADSTSRPVSLSQISNHVDLMNVMAGADMAVVSRYHNMILALMLGKPVIALSYHGKFAALMERFGLGRFCRPLADFDVEWLMQSFSELAVSPPEIADDLLAVAQRCREEVTAQYDVVEALARSGISADGIERSSQGTP